MLLVSSLVSQIPYEAEHGIVSAKPLITSITVEASVPTLRSSATTLVKIGYWGASIATFVLKPSKAGEPALQPSSQPDSEISGPGVDGGEHH